MKLTNEQKLEIQKCRKKKMTLKAIAIKFNVTVSTIKYWCHAEYREKVRADARLSSLNKSPEERKINYAKRLEYNKKYFKYRYNTDKGFRAKHLEVVKKGYRKRTQGI